MKKRNTLTAVLIISLTAVLLMGPAWADTRTMKRRTEGRAEPAGRRALVIGNGAYDVGPLRNPPADARLMADTLEALGFDVTLRTNLDYPGMNGAIDAFGDSLKKGDVGFFFFAGHGVRFRGRNYLVPVDVDLNDGNELRYRAVDAGLVTAKMESAGNPVNIVVLDACRNNPFARTWRSTARAATGPGLAWMDAPPSTKIIFATRPGEKALDGDGANSPFTKSLAAHLKSRDRELEQVIREVYRDVYRETNGVQSPWAAGILVRDVYLARSSGYDESKPGSGRLTVRADVEEAWVFVGDKAYGTAPVSVEVPAGREHRVRVAAEGYVPYTRWVTVAPDEDLKVTALLKPREAREPETQPVSEPVTPPRPPREEPEPGEIWREPATGMEFAWVPGGTFEMGCGSWTGGCDSDEKPVHPVTVGGFWMGRHEVTVAQWERFVSETGYGGDGRNGYKCDGMGDPSFSQAGDHPVACVSWKEATSFADWLSREIGKGVVLPTEAQWEYAARSGGKPEKYAGGGEIDELAWYGGNSGGRTHRVGTKSANGLGLHDMSGNVWEWCSDWKGEYPSGSGTDPTGPSSGPGRVLRGGGWGSGAWHCRSAVRYRLTPVNRYADLGFRLVLPAGQ